MDVVVFTALLIASVRPGTSSIPPVQSPGFLSGSDFLLFIPLALACYCISYWTIGIHPWSLPFQIVAILMLSMASYHLIENPLRRATWIGGRRGVIAFGLPAMAAAAVVILLGQRYGIPSFSGNRSAEVALDSAVPGYVAKYSGRRSTTVSRGPFLGKPADRSKIISTSASRDPADVSSSFSSATVMPPIFPDVGSAIQGRCRRGAQRFATDLPSPAARKRRSGMQVSRPDCEIFASDRTETNILVIRNNYSPRSADGGLRDFSKRLEELLTRTSAAGDEGDLFRAGAEVLQRRTCQLCSPQWYRPDWAMGAECRNGFLEDRGEELARRRDVTEYLLGLSQKEAISSSSTLLTSSAGDRKAIVRR